MSFGFERNVFNYFNFDNYYINAYYSAYAYKNKPTSNQTAVFQRHLKTLKQENTKIKSSSLKSFVNHLEKNGMCVVSFNDTTQTIFIDIDKNGATLYENLKNLNSKLFKSNQRNLLLDFLRIFKPSFWYETNSHQEQNPRFRLAFLFFRKISKEQMTSFVEKISILLKFLSSAEVDKCSKNIKQIWYGTLKNIYIDMQTRVFHIDRALEMLDYFISKFKLISVEETNNNPKFNEKMIFFDLFEEKDSYIDAFWIYVGLYRLNLEHFLITKPKWLKKFEQTMKKKPFFLPKKGTIGYSIMINNLFKKYVN